MLADFQNFPCYVQQEICNKSIVTFNILPTTPYIYVATLPCEM